MNLHRFFQSWTLTETALHVLEYLALVALMSFIVSIIFDATKTRNGNK